MSYYYNYYIGYEKDNKIFPLGPFDNNGQFFSAIWRSRSFASDLHEDFELAPKEKLSEELLKALGRAEIDEEDKIFESPVKVLDLEKLGSSDFIKSGYFLIEDIEEYKKNNDAYDLFYEKLSPEVYAMRLENELKFGLPKPKLDCEGNPFEVHSVSEYAFFAYPDYNCKEYETFLIKEIANTFEFSDLVKNAKIVIIETEG